MKTVAKPKVFISYTWRPDNPSDNPKARVLKLADRLRAAGLDSRIDQYFLHSHHGFVKPQSRVGDPWVKWAGEQIQGADFVLLVCSAQYAATICKSPLWDNSTREQWPDVPDDLKFKLQEPGLTWEHWRAMPDDLKFKLQEYQMDESKGKKKNTVPYTWWDWHFMIQDMESGRAEKHKFIPVGFRPYSSVSQHIPYFIKGECYYNLDSDEDFDGLVRGMKIRPIAQDEALRILASVPQIQLQQLHQLLFCYELYMLPGNSSNASQVLDDLRIGFKEPVVITKENRDSMLILAEEEYKSFDFPFKKREHELQNEFEHVRRVLSPVFKAIPTKAECLTKISHFSRATSTAFLISEYYEGHRLRGSHTVVEVIGAIGLGIEGQFVLEDTLRRWEPEQISFKKVVDIAKQALKDDFERWYISIRGLSPAEDLAEYRKKQKEKDEARDREYAQELEKKLAEFIPDSMALPPVISPEAARFLWKKADEYVACLRGLDPNDEKYKSTVESIAHKAKYLFKPYFPNVSYRIRKSELTWAKIELIVADLLAELALVKDTVEMHEGESTVDIAFLGPTTPASTSLTPHQLRENLQDLLSDRMIREEIGRLWYAVLKTRMDDEMGQRSQSDCVIELLVQAKNRDKLPRLTQALRKIRPDLVGP